jgi:hypothetical protein
MDGSVSPTPGVEQFGINLVSNTSPASFGSDPVQLPDSSASFGQPSPGYNIPNTFKYNDGDIIAESSKSSGKTCFVVSYVVNVSSVTPAGTYLFDQIIVATGTY